MNIVRTVRFFLLLLCASLVALLPAPRLVLAQDGSAGPTIRTFPGITLDPSQGLTLPGGQRFDPSVLIDRFPSIAPRFQARTLPAPSSLAAGSWFYGDFNGDGWTDASLVAAGQVTGVHWRTRNDGPPAVSLRAFPAGMEKRSVWLVADLDGDGKDDIAQAPHAERVIRAWLSRESRTSGAGTFRRAGTDAPLVQQPFVGIWRVADINGDGRDDLLFLPAGRSEIQTFRARSDGSLEAGRFPIDSRVLDVATWLVGDLNGDARDDLVHVAADGSGLRSLVFGSEAVPSRRAQPLSAGYRSVAGRWLLADVDGDGRDDLVHAVGGRNLVNVMRSLGDGRFAAPVSSVGPPGYAIPNGEWLVADVDDDGREDLVHAVAGTSYTHVWTARSGSLGFDVSSPVQTASAPNAAGPWVVGDADGDGRDDLLRGLTSSPRLETLLSRFPRGAPVLGHAFATQMEAVLHALNRLTPAEQVRLRCRLARVATAQAPVRSEILASIGAGSDWIASIEHIQRRFQQAACRPGGDVSARQLAALRVQNYLMEPVLRRFSRGSLLSDDMMLGRLAVETSLDRFFSRCFDPTMRIDAAALAVMDEREFTERLPSLALGSCADAIGGVGRPVSSGVGGYGQCVQDALRASIGRRMQSCGVAADCDATVSSCPDSIPDSLPTFPTQGSDGDPEYDADGYDRDGYDRDGYNRAGLDRDGYRRGNERSGAALAAPTQAELDALLDEVEADERNYGYGTIALVAATVVIVVGGVVFCAVGCGALVGAGIIAAAGAAAAGAFTVNSTSAGFRSEARGLRERGARMCPAILTAAGPMSYLASSADAGAPRRGQEAPFTVFDTLTACACENDPLGPILAGSSDPILGSGRCELGKRLACLREAEAGGDMGPAGLSFECRELLARDNEQATPNDICGVVNCGPDAVVGDDCLCRAAAAPDPDGTSTSGSCQIQCAEGFVPMQGRCGCMPDPGLIPEGGPPIPIPIPIPSGLQGQQGQQGSGR